MKGLTVVFGTSVAVIVLSLVMSIYTAVQKRHAEENAPRTIPTPALAQ